MNFDIKATADQMLLVMQDTVKGDWSKIKGSAIIFLIDRSERLETLANQRLNKEIDDTFLRKRLEDEKELLLAELDAEKIISKAIAQEAANAAMDVLSNAIFMAVRTFI